MKLFSRILDSSSDISPSALSSVSSTDSSTTSTSQTNNVTLVTPSKRPRSYVSETSSSSILNRPPIFEIPITTRTQTTSNTTPLVHIPHPETVEQYVNYKHPTAIKTVRLQPQLNLVHIPDAEYAQLPPLKLPSELSTTSSKVYPLSTATSKLYPPLKPLRKPSTSFSNLLDTNFEYTPSRETSSTPFIPQNRYNLRNLPSRRLSTDTSTLHLSTRSSNSSLRLLRQHAQPLSSETHSSELVPSPYFTSGFDTASLLTSDAQTALLSGNLFSEVIIPTPVPVHVRLPEYYTADHSRPPTPNFSDYPLRVDGITIYDPQNDPRFSILAERFISNNDLLSHKRKETELKRLQTPNLELKFEVKVKFQGLNPHPIFHVSKIEHKTSPASFEVVHIEFERDLTQPTITFGKIIFCNPYSGLKYTSSF